MTTIRVEYISPSDGNSIRFTDGNDSLVPTPDAYDHETVEVEYPSEVAYQVREDARRELGNHRDEYGRDPSALVLGEREYAILDALFREKLGCPLGDELEGVPIATVPGRMIHASKPKENAIWDEVSDEGDR